MDLATVEPSLSGPKRPQDRVSLSEMKTHWRTSLNAEMGHQGHGIDPSRNSDSSPIEGRGSDLKHGDVVIAAITSCTNTSNPSVMIAAGLVARNARSRGLKIKPWVKPSLAPGSRVVTEYYDASGLSDDLDSLGFSVVGYGCTTCIGNSGPLPKNIVQAIEKEDRVLEKAKRIIKDFKLDMKLADVDFQGDSSKATFFYTAEKRVDFRGLIREYSTQFKLKL